MLPELQPSDCACWPVAHNRSAAATGAAYNQNAREFRSIHGGRLKLACPKQFFDTKRDAKNALLATVEKIKTEGSNVGLFNNLKVWACSRCGRWHIHPMRAIDPDFRRKEATA